MTKKNGARITINSNWCKKCGICIALCPTKVYTADRNGAPVVSKPEECVMCMMCEKRCPDLAISVEAGGEKDE